MHAISSVENANIHHSAAKVAKASHIYKHSILFFSFLVTICHGLATACWLRLAPCRLLRVNYFMLATACCYFMLTTACWLFHVDYCVLATACAVLTILC